MAHSLKNVLLLYGFASCLLLCNINANPGRNPVVTISGSSSSAGATGVKTGTCAYTDSTGVVVTIAYEKDKDDKFIKGNITNGNTNKSVEDALDECQNSMKDKFGKTNFFDNDQEDPFQDFENKFNFSKNTFGNSWGLPKWNDPDTLDETGGQTNANSIPGGLGEDEGPVNVTDKLDNTGEQEVNVTDAIRDIEEKKMVNGTDTLHNVEEQEVNITDMLDDTGKQEMNVTDMLDDNGKQEMNVSSAVRDTEEEKEVNVNNTVGDTLEQKDVNVNNTVGDTEEGKEVNVNTVGDTEEQQDVNVINTVGDTEEQKDVSVPDRLPTMDASEGQTITGLTNPLRVIKEQMDELENSYARQMEDFRRMQEELENEMDSMLEKIHFQQATIQNQFTRYQENLTGNDPFKFSAFF